MKEHRQFIRVGKSLKISYQVLKGFPSISSETDDISGAGIRLPISQKLEPGMALDLEICTSEFGECISVAARVVWRKNSKDKKFPYIAGIKFININKIARDKLLNYIRAEPEAESLNLDE